VRPSYKICPANLIKLAKGSPALLSSSYYSASSYPSRTISLEEANLLPGAVSPQRASAAKSPTLASSSLLSALHFDDLSKIVVVPPRARIHCSKAAAAATLRSRQKTRAEVKDYNCKSFSAPSTKAVHPCDKVLDYREASVFGPSLPSSIEPAACHWTNASKICGSSIPSKNFAPRSRLPLLLELWSWIFSQYLCVW
jgi:hypothetical protein